MISNRCLPVLLVVALLACAGADETADTTSDAATAAPGSEVGDDPDTATDSEAAALPAGYALRLDREGSDRADFRVQMEQGDLHVRTGPAGILYSETDRVEEGDYTVSASFTEIGAPPDHREAFGLLIGGDGLQGPDQRYSYFLVRADGSYLIKRRRGAETSEVSGGWTESEAVNAAGEGGDVTNRLEVAVRGDGVHFSINGSEVAVVPADELDTHGVAGVRINHNLNVRVSEFALASRTG